MSETLTGTPHRSSIGALTIGALGVVFGDIGTSPLYAIKESFHVHNGRQLEVTPDNVVGILSLVFWAMTIVITIKYLRYVMRADNHGEGGILALTALIRPATTAANIQRSSILVLLGLFGAALLYGDGMITPAISVVSAVEGTTVVTETLDPWVVPIASVILVGLFSVQRRGTAAVGRAFGPVMIVWFTVLGVLGLAHIADAPEVFRALNPLEGLGFMAENGLTSFLALGSVFLVVTGGEALYADMGHFGRRPIRYGWFAIVMPGLLLNYFGQGAMLIDDPSLIDNPFYRMGPRWALWPMVILATMATVIASQALISGAFSLTKQAVQLGYLPRMRIRHTSEAEQGQIYVPTVNWVLLVACVGLVVGFQNSTNLAAAYGLAVTMTMVITTLLFFSYSRTQMGWSLARAGSIACGFLVVDLAFFGANIPKIPNGGWFPLIVGGIVMLVLTTWFTGRRITGERLAESTDPLREFIESVPPPGAAGRTDGLGVYLGSNPQKVPQALQVHFRHARTLPSQACILSVKTDDAPHVDRDHRLECEDLGNGFVRLTYHVGFMDEIDVPAVLTDRGRELTGFDFDHASYVLGRESLRVTERRGMAIWREHLYVFMLRNARTADAFFRLPTEKTVELGVQVEI